MANSGPIRKLVGCLASGLIAAFGTGILASLIYGPPNVVQDYRNHSLERFAFLVSLAFLGGCAVGYDSTLIKEKSAFICQVIGWFAVGLIYLLFTDLPWREVFSVIGILAPGIVCGVIFSRIAWNKPNSEKN